MPANVCMLNQLCEDVDPGCDLPLSASGLTRDARRVRIQLRPVPFFAKVAAAPGESTITPIDICVSATGARRATGYFICDWGPRDGSSVRFECVDVFEFDDDGGIERMIIVYDTYPIRNAVGDKYA